ncbi:hypothetical protein CAEBREN_28241 [Caenorhabditis brenneri]|uniref:BRCT domain-containing protein n=1 Tax=Caenorhabditis brenneri TaxID=135651 RepID=G0MDR7_CAEBE|nr:hypothetical protein CAEBREN_28241 [Caenorhabditis brenneri]
MLIWAIVFHISLGLTEGAQAKTDLELFASNLQILSRITNAIALQAGAIQKSIPSREVVAELLKVNPKHFDPIVGVEAQNAIKTLTKLKDGMKSVSRDSLPSDADNEKLKKQLEGVVESMQSPDDWSEKGDIASKNLEKMLTGLSNTPSTYEQKCPMSIVSKAGKLAGIYRNYSDPNDMNNINDFSNELGDFVECYTSILDYGESVRKLANDSTITEYDSALNIAKETPEALNDLSKRMEALKMIVASISTVWDHKAELQGSLGDQILKTYTAHKQHSEAMEPPLPSFTIAFFEPKELGYVFNDLKSSWFKKHVVRGASTHQLEKSLAPIHEISKSFVDLESAWKPIHQVDFSEKSYAAMPGVAKHLDRLEKLVQIPAISFHMSDFLNSQAKHLEVCKQQSHDDFSKTIEKFTKQEAYKISVTAAIHGLSTFLNDVMKQHEGFQNMPKIANCSQKMMENPNNMDVSLRIGHMAYQFNMCTFPEKIKFVPFFDLFETLHQKQLAIFGALKAFNGNPASQNQITFKDVIDKSKVLDGMKCLREKKFDSDNVLKIADFLVKLRTFPDDSTVDFVIAYLDKIAKVKTALESTRKQIQAVGRRSKRDTKNTNNPVLLMKNSKIQAENIAVCTLALWNLIEIRSKKRDLLSVGNSFNDNVTDLMRSAKVIDNFIDPKENIKELLKQADEINVISKKLRSQSLLNMSTIFQDVGNIRGVVGNREAVWSLARQNKNDKTYQVAIPEWKTLAEVNLDFTMYHSRIKDGHSTVAGLLEYFDQIFGHAKPLEPKTIVVENPLSWIVICGTLVGGILIFLVICATVYGFTASGREKYKNIYLYYFGKPEDFEKRWRYSAFADSENGKNALLDACREINKTNVLKWLKKGAYVNAYNKFGNTALHVAANSGHADIVEVLIHHGADMTLLNHKNRTPEQYVPAAEIPTMNQKDQARFTKTQLLLIKNRRKKFRKSVPLIFPVSSYHVYVDRGAEGKEMDAFLEAFKSIATLEIDGQNITHVIVKVDASGILETTDFELLNFIFKGAIIMRHTWMKACLENKQAINHDSLYLVEKVKYNGVVYDTIPKWSNAMAKAEMPYLHGVFAVIVGQKYDNVSIIHTMITEQGGNMCVDEFPQKAGFNIGSHPYLHAHLGPLFVIHDGTEPLLEYRNDKDKMYTFFTEEEFMAFMLKREINKDTSANPITVWKNSEND